MTTKNIIPQADGEGSIGINGTSWASGVFNTGVFEDLLVGGNSVVLSSDFGIALDNYISKSEISIGVDNNVGIGTPNPQNNLHILGSNPAFKLEGSQPRIWLKEEDTTDLNSLIRLKNSSFTIDTVGDDDQFQQNRFTILNGNGNVGINTLTPAAKLDVQGDISISGAIVSSDSDGRVLFSDQGLMVGQAEVKPDPTDPESLYFSKTPLIPFSL